MARDLVKRYVWLVDTIRRYGRITRRELEECWKRSTFSRGEALSRRTLYSYRMAVRDIFNLSIEIDPSTFEYYIVESDDHNQRVTEWLLNTSSMNEVLSGSREISDKIFIDDVPSAREHLDTAIAALKSRHPVRFTYHSYTRSQPTAGVVLEPYFLKIFKQRWYMIGRNTGENRIKTYALDRMTDVVLLPDEFRDDPRFDPETYFRDSYGIVVTQSEVRRVAIKADLRQAKYLRALPLHHSQTEIVHDSFSIFYYKLRITDDFVEELLSHGPRLTVLEPPELRAKMKQELSAALAGYL